MRYNLEAIKAFSFWGDLKVMVMTVLAVLGKDYSREEKTISEDTKYD